MRGRSFKAHRLLGRGLVVGLALVGSNPVRGQDPAGRLWSRVERTPGALAPAPAWHGLSEARSVRVRLNTLALEDLLDRVPWRRVRRPSGPR